MSVFHQSDLSQWSWCPAKAKYEREGQPTRQLSGTAYGSVMHYALLEVFERQRHTDGITITAATEAAVESFRHYWHPMHIQAICNPVDVWMPNHNFNGLLNKGEDQIRAYAKLVANREEIVLATEIGFQVPIDGTWDDDLAAPHILAGTIDRLALVKKKGIWHVEVGDVKTGKDYTYLRQNLQFSAYTYATTKPEFWRGWNGEDGFGDAYGTELYEKFTNAARRSTWINMNKMSFQDGGWRGPKDWQRFAMAIEELAKAVKYDVFPFNISGSTCTFCEFRDICGGIGVAEDDHGAPAPTAPGRKRAA